MAMDALKLHDPSMFGASFALGSLLIGLSGLSALIAAA